MNNSLTLVLHCYRGQLKVWPFDYEWHEVTGTWSRLLEEAEDFGKWSNADVRYVIYDDRDDFVLAYKDSYSDLLQYLRKEVALWKESNQT